MAAEQLRARRWQLAQAECSSPASSPRVQREHVRSPPVAPCARFNNAPITRMQVHAPESTSCTAVSSLAASNVPVRASDLNQRPGVFHNQPWPPFQLGRCKTSCHCLCVSFYALALWTLPANRLLCRELDALFAAGSPFHSPQVTRFLLLFSPHS
jgi:hypothetical protein